MIQVILLSLKIIGITVLSLLGLLLLVLALVLFVPIFYRVRIVHNKEKTQVNAKASFLFPLFVVSCQYLKKFTYRIRVVGFSVLDSEKPKKEKKEKKSQKAKKEKVKKKKAGKRSEKDSASEQPAGTEMIPEQVKPQETENRPPVAETAEPKQENEPEQKTGFFKKLSLKLKKIRETISNIINKIKKLLHQK